MIICITVLVMQLVLKIRTASSLLSLKSYREGQEITPNQSSSFLF